MYAEERTRKMTNEIVSMLHVVFHTGIWRFRAFPTPSRALPLRLRSGNYSRKDPIWARLPFDWGETTKGKR